MSTAEMDCVLDIELRLPAKEVLDPCEPSGAAMKVAMARLSDLDIERMKPLQLVDVIKVSGVFALRAWFPQLQFMERDELRRLAYLARRTCRRQINAAYEHRGWQVPFMDVL